MLKNADQIIFGGEISYTTPKWNLSGKAAQDDCLKLYIPLDGWAQVDLEGKKIEFSPGKVYLLNAKFLRSQLYREEFYHFWIHFMPTSLRLRHIIFKSFRLCQWTTKQLPFKDELCVGMQQWGIRRQQRCTKSDNVPWPVLIADDSFQLKTQAYLTYLIGDVLQKQKICLSSKEQLLLDKLLPAIDFMDTHYLDNPALDQVAQKVFMAPSYFHRQFVKHFDLSPHRYMQRKRLLDARHLLRNTNQTVKQIAQTCGYENEFYFSKVFKKEYNTTPTKLRKMHFAE